MRTYSLSPMQVQVMKVAGGAFAYALWCAASLALGAAYRWVSKSPLMLEALASPIVDQVAEKPFNGRSALNVLVLGCDQDLSYRGTKVLRKQARSDMMMVARFDFGNRRISGISIPRDTLASPPGYGRQKINAFHAIGGPALAQSAVESLLSISIERVVVLDFDAFQEMVDLVGGIDLYVEKRMVHTDRAAKLFINLKPGRQHLNGYDAMCYVRYRSGDSDFKRIERQRNFLLSFKDAVKSDLLKLPDVANKAKDMIGSALTNREIIVLAKFAQEVGADNIKMGVVPVLDLPGSRSYDLEVDLGKLDDTLIQYHLMSPLGDSQ